MTERKGQGVFVTCTLADGVLLRGSAMQQSGVDRRVLVGSDTIHLSYHQASPLYPLPPSLPAAEDAELSLPSSQRSPERRRPCRGSRPRLSPARKSQRWAWTLTPCCAG